MKLDISLINHIKMKDPSFSVYIDNKTKNTPNDDFLQQYMNTIYPKPTNEWVDETMVSKCQTCNSEFSLFTRKHHCRACGGVYCSSCCNIYTIIPSHLIDVPDENNSIKVSITNMYHYWKNEDKKLVCVECNKKIIKLLKIEWIIKICEFLELQDLFNILSVSRNFHNAGIHWLSKFRYIQYLPLESPYTKWDCRMLWNLRKNIISHNNWYTCLIKSVIFSYLQYKQNNIGELIELIKKNDNKKNINCWSLMCSRKCKFEIDIIDILDMLQFLCKLNNGIKLFWIKEELRSLFTILIDRVTENNYMFNENIIPLLSITLRMLFDTDYEINEKYITGMLDKIIKNNYNNIVIFALEFNYLNGGNDNSNGKKKFCAIVHDYIFNKLNPENKKLLAKTIETIKYINNSKREELYRLLTKNNDNNGKKMSDILPILYPFDTEYIITDIISVKELESNSKPLLVKVFIQKMNTSSITKIKKKFIIKKDPHLRKENIVSSLISLLQDKLYVQFKKDGIKSFDKIPTYKILMINNELGIIEFVDDSITLRQIGMKGYTIQNYIMEQNKDEKIGSIKNKFIKSLAISSCLSYILGLGDRHLDNIMINVKGQLFHIDYGYLMENPMTNIFGAPVIRVTKDMIDFLGGQNSKYYTEFKEYVIKVFDILRIYGNIILNYYFILGHEGIINWRDFKKKITNRFLKGLSIKDVEISLIKEIEMSTNSYSAYFMDVCHHYNSKIKTTFK